jgi:hypothetical protein
LAPRATLASARCAARAECSAARSSLFFMVTRKKWGPHEHSSARTDATDVKKKGGKKRRRAASARRRPSAEKGSAAARRPAWASSTRGAGGERGAGGAARTRPRGSF